MLGPLIEKNCIWKFCYSKLEYYFPTIVLFRENILARKVTKRLREQVKLFGLIFSCEVTKRDFFGRLQSDQTTNNKLAYIVWTITT
jgi:hypothetical protein